jgi:hypothetical protein
MVMLLLFFVSSVAAALCVGKFGGRFNIFGGRNLAGGVE